ncbi:MAG: histidine kinase N-terminal 7TM domain-containing protein, partial [bacterium]
MLYNIVMAMIILWRTHSHRAGGSFAWYILSTAAWTACVATMQFAGDIERTLWLCRATFFFSTFFSISWLWFCADFPVVSVRFRKIALALTIISLPWLYISWTPLLISTVKYQPWGVDAGVGPLVGLFSTWLVVSSTIGAIHLYIKKSRVSGFEKLQIRYILLGFAGLLIFGAMCNSILPAITHSTRFAPLGPLASLFITTTTTYAIVRYRLMDITIVLRASLIYSVTIGTLSLFFALMVPILDHALATRISFFPRAGSFIMAFLIALAFQPLRRQVQAIVDKRFFKSVYDYRSTLRDAGNALASAQDREKLVNTLLSAINRTLRPRNSTIFLPVRNE